ncbi:MAG: ankyrin repeat domain-containing protein [Acidobacteria bacterium]|nr:ankyrin repeat domain-containing protein [Acidobacteriota bacterium]
MQALEANLRERRWQDALVLLGTGIAARQLREGIYAVVAGRRIDVLRALLEAGFDPDRGTYALEAAAAAGWEEGVQLLLERGADPARGSVSCPPLFAAIARGHDDVAAVLVRGGAPLALRGQPLLVAAAHGGLTRTVEAMLARGADADSCGDVRRLRVGPTAVVTTTEVLYANAPAVVVAAGEGHQDVLDHLLAAGADLGAHDDIGMTALAAARRGGHEGIAARLVRAHAGPRATFSPGEGLFAAIDRGDLDAVTRGLATGVAVDTTDGRSASRGRTPLLAAVVRDWPALASLLLAAGAEPDRRDGDERKHLGELGGMPRPVDFTREEWLWRRGYTPLMVAALLGRSECARVLLDRGASVDLLDHVGYSPLMLASGNGHGDIVAALLAAGADPNLRGYQRDTAFHCAAGDLHTGIARQLLSAGANPNARNRSGDSALDIARLVRDDELIALLENATVSGRRGPNRD